MRGLIPLTFLVPHCPIGKMRELIAEWEEMYGAEWEARPRSAGVHGQLKEQCLVQFNGEPKSVKLVKVKGVSQQKVRMACIHLYEDGRLERVGHGVYRRTKLES